MPNCARLLLRAVVVERLRRGLARGRLVAEAVSHPPTSWWSMPFYPSRRASQPYRELRRDRPRRPPPGTACVCPFIPQQLYSREFRTFASKRSVSSFGMKCAWTSMTCLHVEAAPLRASIALRLRDGRSARVVEAPRIERVIDGVAIAAGAPRGGSFARALLPEGRERRGACSVDDRHGGISIALGIRQSIKVPLASCRPRMRTSRTGRRRYVRDPAVGHAVHDVGVDHHPAVVAADVSPDHGLAGVRVDLDQNDVRLEGLAGVDLDAPLRGRQRTAGRHLPDELRLQARLQAGRHLV